MSIEKSANATSSTEKTEKMVEKSQAKEGNLGKNEADAAAVTKASGSSGDVGNVKKEGEKAKDPATVREKSEKQLLGRKGNGEEPLKKRDTDARKKTKQQDEGASRGGTQRKGEDAAGETEKKKSVEGAAGKERQEEKDAGEKKEKTEKKEETEKKKPEGKRDAAAEASASTKKATGPKQYGALSPPSFMLSEMVQEDAIFSSFHYVGLTECDDRVYGYGTLSADSTTSLGDEGMVDFDPITNQFLLIYCERFDLERSKSQDSENKSNNGSTRRSPGCRERATLAARRVISKSSSSALAGGEGEAAQPKAGESNKGSSEVVWRLLLFGGYDASSAKLSNELWEFRLPPRLAPSMPFASLPSVGSWRELMVSGTKPSPRGDHAVCTSPTKTRMYMFGGVGEANQLLNDAYVFTENNKWIELSGGKEGDPRPDPRRCHTLACGADAGGGTLLYLFGGDFTTRGREASNDLWIYSVKQNGWTRITEASGTPPSPRFQHASAFATNKVWIGGGISPGWFGSTELKDLFGFDVTALYWFECAISLGRMERVLSRFRPLAYIPATKSFFIFGCTEDKQFQQAQAAVCALTPVCTMESLMPLQRVQDSMKQTMDSLNTEQDALQDVLRRVDEKLPVLREQISSFEEKHKELQQKLRVVDEKKKKLDALTTLILDSKAGKRLENLESTCPEPEAMEHTATEIEKVLQQVKKVMKTKAAAEDVAFLVEAVEKLSK